MKQITDDYCSFEIAKLLKEKGFPQCKKEDGFRGFKYNIDGELTFAPYAEHYRVVTQSLALKWLREVHNIFIEIKFLFNQFTEEPSYKAMIWDISEEKGIPLPGDIEFMFYETCVSEALKYTLKNLI